MKISDYINELRHLLLTDGNIEVDGVVMDEEKCCVKIGDNWFRFNEYKETPNIPSPFEGEIEYTMNYLYGDKPYIKESIKEEENNGQSN